MLPNRRLLRQTSQLRPKLQQAANIKRRFRVTVSTCEVLGPDVSREDGPRGPEHDARYGPRTKKHSLGAANLPLCDLRRDTEDLVCGVHAACPVHVAIIIV